MSESLIIQNILFLLISALIGGFFARLIKQPLILGILLGGVIGRLVFNSRIEGIEAVSEIGIIFLMFSLGLELTLSKLAKFGKIVVLGGSLQLLATTFILCLFFTFFLKFNPLASFVLAAGFSFSSTALVVKMLSEGAEINTVHGQIMAGWLLLQDLAVIPMVIILPGLVAKTDILGLSLKTLSLATILLGAVFLIGRVLAPRLVRIMTSFGSHELLVLTAVCLALGTGALMTLFGISPTFGAFLAGVVISETQENHAIFAETRPLRDLFSILFFVALGFSVSPFYILSNLGLVILVALAILLIKSLVIFFVTRLFNYYGKTSIYLSLGLAQAGEFSFVVFLIAKSLNILSEDLLSLGMSATLVTFLVTPLMFKSMLPLWRHLKKIKWFSVSEKRISLESDLENHIIICGFGRMGKWVGKGLLDVGVKFVVIEFNQQIARQARNEGIKVVYGDPSYAEVLEAAGVSRARAIIISIPDTVAQEEIISYCQSKKYNIKIITRVHQDSDIKKLSQLKVEKIIQPEFEGAIAAIRSVLVNLGRDKVDIALKLKNLRLSHSLCK